MSDTAPTNLTEFTTRLVEALEADKDSSTDGLCVSYSGPWSCVTVPGLYEVSVGWGGDAVEVEAELHRHNLLYGEDTGVEQVMCEYVRDWEFIIAVTVGWLNGNGNNPEDYL